MIYYGQNLYFTGIIKRGTDDAGNPFVFIRIVMPNNGLLCASETEQKALGRNLDKIATDIVIGHLHSMVGVTTKIFDADFFLN